MKDSFLKLRIKDEEYIKFQEVCETKGKSMSEVLRSFITTYTTSENVILLNMDKELLKNSIELCKEKKIRLNDLVKFLLNSAIKNKDKI
jgi:antitoxin component of RelBE/YafQ-DinJ toxin-antitoxin module